MQKPKGQRALIIMAGLCVLSFVVYSLFFSFGFAVLIIGSLVFHEYGHVWAMQRCGMEVRGIYLIPFIGGVAVGQSKSPSQAATVFIYLAGPAFGLVLAVVTACGYLLTGWPLLAGAACWMAILNLLNLFPVFPLDGGGVLRAIAYSVPTVLGGVLQVISAALAILLAFFGGNLLLFLIAFFACRECMDFLFARARREKLLMLYSSYVQELQMVGLSMKKRLYLSLLLQERQGINLLEADRSIPSNIGLLSTLERAEEHLREPPPLDSRNICFSVGGYALLVSVLLMLGVITGMVPGSFESITALIGQ